MPPVLIGARGLVIASSKGGLAPNPYEAIGGLNSFFAPDNPNIALWRISGGIIAINSRSSISRLDFMAPTGFIEAWSPTISAINGSKLGFHFAAASTQVLGQPTAATDIVDDDGSMTVFAVFKTSIAAGGAWIYGKGKAAARRWGLSQSDVGDGRMQFGINGTSSGAPDVQNGRSDNVLTDGLPHRLIGIYNPANAPDPTLTMYIDGVLQADSKVVVGPLQTTTDRVGLGASIELGDYFDGWLTDIGSYDHAFTDPAEIAKLDAIMLKRITP